MYVHPRGPARDIQCISRMSIPYTLWERSHSLVIHTLSTIYPISCRCKRVAWITTASIFPSVGSCQLSHILPIHCGLIILSYPADIRLCVVYWLAVGYPSPCSDDIPIPATTSLSFTRAAVLLSTWTDTLSRPWPNPAVTGTKRPIWRIFGHAWPVGRQHCSYEPALLSARYIATLTHDHPAHQATGGPIPRLMDVLLHSLRRYSDTGSFDSSDAGICMPNHSGSPPTWRRRLGWIWSSVSATGVHQPCTPLECTWTQPPSCHYPRSVDVGRDVVHHLSGVWPYSQPLRIGLAPAAVAGTLTNCHISSFLPPPLDAWRHFSVFVWDGKRVPAPGHSVFFAIFAPHAASHTRHVIAQIRQRSQSTKCSPVYPHAHISSPWTLEVHLALMTTVVVFHKYIWTWTSDGHNLCLIVWVI